MGCVPERSLQHESGSYWAMSSGTALCWYDGTEDTGSGGNEMLWWHHVHCYPQLWSSSVRLHIQHVTAAHAVGNIDLKMVTWSRAERHRSGFETRRLVLFGASEWNLRSSSLKGLKPKEQRQEVSTHRGEYQTIVMLHTLQCFQSLVMGNFLFFKCDTKININHY